MEHRDAHAGPQVRLDREALGALMSSRLIAPKVGSSAAHVAEPGRVRGIHLDVEHVDAGEFLEQDRLALHHRLAGERADVAQAEHGAAVGDHPDQVAARGVEAGVVGVLDDRLAGGGNPGRIGQRQVVLVAIRLVPRSPVSPAAAGVIVQRRRRKSSSIRTLPQISGVIQGGRLGARRGRSIRTASRDLSAHC